MGSDRIDALNFWAGRWATTMLAGAVDAAGLLAVVGLIWLAVRRRVAPGVGCWLFLLVPLKLLSPLVVAVPAPLAGWTPAARLAARGEAPRPVAPVADRPGPAVAAAVAANRADHASPALPPDAPRVRPAVAASPAATRSAASVVAAAPSPGGPPVRPSGAAVALLGWLGGVAWLAGRSTRNQLAFRARLRRASMVDPAALPVDLAALRRLAGVRRPVRLVADGAIASPAAWGIVRPTILLPAGIETTLSPEQLRWVLLHELAHIRRGDLILAAVQRVAAILHFANPAVWVANRMVARLREFACDDFALAVGRTPPVEAGAAFVGILGRPERRPGLRGALGVFGLDSRAACFGRVARLLDADRPIRVRVGIPARLALVLLAAATLPHLRAVGGPPPATVQESPARRDVPAAVVPPPGPLLDGRDFELTVVGPGGKPVAGALIDLSTDRETTADQIRRGRLIGRGPYRVDLAADEDGKLAISYPKAPTDLNLFIVSPGFGPYWARWSQPQHGEAVPARFTAELEAGWTVGGVVVDAAGRPVVGARVHPRIEFRKRPGLFQQLGIGDELTTDDAGRWRFESVPASLTAVPIAIDRPDFRPAGLSLPRDGYGIEAGGEPTARSVLDRGLIVRGQVVDETGRPIVGARVRALAEDATREARTGADGSYKLEGCSPARATIVVMAPKRAIDEKSVLIEPGMAAVDFAVPPSPGVRVRVLDHRGQPVPRARIFFQQWRGSPTYAAFRGIADRADEFGVWTWDEAPVDEFRADICPTGRDGMQLVMQALVARAEEYVFRLPPALVVTGRVVDAATKQPIPAFKVVPGGRYDNGRQWHPQEANQGTMGRYEYRGNRGGQKYLLRIEAVGYLPAVSRELNWDEGDVTLDFELGRGAGVAAKVVTPDLQPAAGAVVALGVHTSQIGIKDGRIDDSSTYASRQVADAAGRFEFPAQAEDFQLVITHPAGYANYKAPGDWDAVKIIRLEPWARVEGTMRIGAAPAANIPLRLEAAGKADEPQVAHLYKQYETTTGPDGRFAFERVIPGRASIGRRLLITVDDGARDIASAYMVPLGLPAGATVRLELGGTGRPVVGKLVPLDGFRGTPGWNFVQVIIRPDAGGGDLASAWYVTVGRDGTFRADDVPAGRYTLDIMGDPFKFPFAAGTLDHYPFRVPAIDGGGATGPPVDLGDLKLHDRALRPPPI